MLQSFASQLVDQVFQNVEFEELREVLRLPSLPPHLTNIQKGLYND